MQEGKKEKTMPREPICDCGKPISKCTCKGHNHKNTKGERTMSKAMCKCGSGMTKAMCKCGGMGKRGRMYKDAGGGDGSYIPQGGYVGLPNGGVPPMYPMYVGYAGAPNGGVPPMYPQGLDVIETPIPTKTRSDSMFPKGPTPSSYLPNRNRTVTPDKVNKRGSITKTSPYPPPSPYEDIYGGDDDESMYETIASLMGKIPQGMKNIFNRMYNNKPSGRVGGMVKRGSVSKARIPFPPPPSPDRIIEPPFGGKKRGKGNIYGTVMSFAGEIPGKMKDMLGLGDMYDIFGGSPMKLFNRMNKRGKNVSKAWPWEESEFERNGGKTGPQRPRSYGQDFGFEAFDNYNPAENAVRQMMPTPNNMAEYVSRQKEKEFAEALGELMGAYGNRFKTSFGNWDWMARKMGQADRAANNTANYLYERFGPKNERMPQPMLKRLSKSMKMDSDMAKTPQKITPKRSIRHTDKYFK
jgi:hypothetical protein